MDNPSRSPDSGAAADPEHVRQPGPDENDDVRLRRRAIGVVVAYFLLDGIMRSGYFHFGARAEGLAPPFADALFSELTGSLATVIVFFLFVVPTSRRFPLRGEGWPSRLVPHLVALVAFSLTKTGLMWVQRTLLWPVVGLGRYDYGDLEYRFPMEAANDVTGYVLLTVGVHIWDAWLERRARELRRARLEARMSEARLAALQGQLQPHFLFNTLNVISAVLYEDARRADELITRLSDLLRSSLDAPARPEVALEEELGILGQYVELMEARFGDRLSVNVDVEADARGATVPVFLLQPLVENAIQYAVAPSAARGEVRVAVSRHDSTLRIDVDDDGPGIPGDPDLVVGQGVGLGNLRDRLAHLHGDRARLSLENRAQGGLRVRVHLPWRPADDGPDPGAERG
jgi:signal transduction histidine kinase